MQIFKPRGVIAAVVTPFKPDYELDEEGLKKLVDYLTKNRVHGIMTTGGNGEFPHLLHEERWKVLEVAIEAAKGRVPIIACTASCSTKETLMLTGHAKEVGADAVIIVPPYYFKLPEESIYEHYKTVAEKVKVPIIVYNNPEYTGNNICPKLMAKLSEIEGIVGLKQSNYDISQTTEIIRLVGDKIAVLTGIDSQLYPTLCIGGKGVFSTAACVLPRQMVELYEAFESGDYSKALKIHMKLQTINRFLEYDPGYVAPCKEMLRMLGLPAGPVRPPLPPFPSEKRTEIEEALKALLCHKKGRN
jgi:4-hydroxy-tetrahydrodipicolinate synthase